jgi:hypothetical protein
MSTSPAFGRAALALAAALLGPTACGGEPPAATLSIGLAERDLLADLSRLDVAFHPPERACETIRRAPTVKALYRFTPSLAEAQAGVLFDGLFAMRYRVFVQGFDAAGRLIGVGCPEALVEVRTGETTDVDVRMLRTVR